MSFDEELLRTVNQDMANPLIDPVMVGFSILGLTVIWIALAVPLWLRREKRSALELVLLILAVDITVFIVKLLVARDRPSEVRLVFPWFLDNYSFPSGHAARAFAVLVLFSVPSDHHACSALERSVPILLFAYAFMISLSRLYLGAHYPSDVLAGAFVGLGLGYAFLKALKTKPVRDFRDRLIEAIEQLLRRIR